MRDRYYSFDEARRLAEEFEALLRGRGINIVAGSVLEDAVLSIYEINERRRDFESQVPQSEVRKLLQNLVGVADLAHKVLRVRAHRDFGQLLPHFHKLNSGNPIQSRKANYTDQDSRKLFELTFASLIMDVGHDIAMDDPDSSKGDNPDIIATIDGTRWGFACKVPQSRTPNSLYENIVKGIDQIEKSESEIGTVVLGLRDIISREKYWPVGEDGSVQAFANVDYAIQTLSEETLGLWEEMRCALDPQSLLDLFSSPKSINGFSTYTFVAASVMKDQRLTPTSLAMVGVAQCLKVSDEHRKVMERISKSAQWGS